MSQMIEQEVHKRATEMKVCSTSIISKETSLNVQTSVKRLRGPCCRGLLNLLTLSEPVLRKQSLT